MYLKQRRIIFFLFIFFHSGYCLAEKLYEYRDEKGVLHFSNISPDTQLPVTVKQVRVTGVENRMQVRNVGSDEEPLLIVYNGYGGPVEMEFALLEANNISSDPEFPFRIVIPANREVKAIHIWPTQKNRSSFCRYNYRYCPGDSKAIHHPVKPYRPPFESGNAYLISQAFHGTFSHNNAQSEYAIDIAMPIGTPVCAIRSGIVMDIANDFFTGGTDREDYSRRANFIRILHDDGTMALYAHLNVETIRVGIGREVSEGEVIAESGDTGYSSGPHLHLVIQKNIDMQLVSIPFEINQDGKAVVPQENMLLRAQ